MSRDFTLNWKPSFFERILKSTQVEVATRAAAERVKNAWQESAPYKTGDYHDGIHIETKQAAKRTVYRVESSDWKTMLLEAKGGYGARALKAGKE